VIVAVLLLANFPVALLYARTGSRLLTEYVVVVSNRTTSTVERFAIVGPGCNLELGPLRPGTSQTARLEFSADGTLTYSTTHGGHHDSGTIEGYVTVNMAGRRNVLITNEGVRVE
jgi:hypothetical protein